jgi:DNA polymerase-3 subunit chi
MAEIGFYHLTRSDYCAALPALLGRTLALNERAAVVCAEPAQLQQIDTALWQSQHPDWLPHGTAATPYPEWQPIFLTLDGTANPAGANFLFRIGGAVAPIASFNRVFDLFDGNDEAAVLAARTRWREAKAAGHSLTYWKQEETGWVKAG